MPLTPLSRRREPLPSSMLRSPAATAPAPPPSPSDRGLCAHSGPGDWLSLPIRGCAGWLAGGERRSVCVFVCVGARRGVEVGEGCARACVCACVCARVSVWRAGGRVCAREDSRAGATGCACVCYGFDSRAGCTLVLGGSQAQVVLGRPPPNRFRSSSTSSSSSRGGGGSGSSSSAAQRAALCRSEHRLGSPGGG